MRLTRLPCLVATVGLALAGCDKPAPPAPPSASGPATAPADRAQAPPAPAPATAPAARLPKPTLGLHDAALTGDAEQIRRHIAWGTDLNARAEDGKTALAHAADQGKMEVLKLLVAAGADVMARNTGPAGGSTPLHYACGHRGREEMIRYLIAHGAKVDTPGMLNATPLHIAAASGYPTNIDILIAAGAAVDPRKDGQLTPLHEAARAGSDNATAVAALLKHKAKIDARDKRGLTPIHMAASEGNVGVLQVLLDAGADPNVKDPKDRTPLWYAERRRRTPAAELLKARGAK